MSVERCEVIAAWLADRLLPHGSSPARIWRLADELDAHISDIEALDWPGEAAAMDAVHHASPGWRSPKKEGHR